MAKRRKNKSELSRGPFDSKDVERALKLDGWTRRTGGGGHGVYYDSHPTKEGKVPISTEWTGLRCWDPIVRGFLETMHVSKDELLHLLNGQKP